MFRQLLRALGINSSIIRTEFDWIGLDSNPTRTTYSHVKIIISTSCCIRTIVHQVGFSLHNYIQMHGQQNIKFCRIVYFFTPPYASYISFRYVWCNHSIMQKGLISVHSLLTIGSHVFTCMNILVLKTSCVLLVCLMGFCCCLMIIQSQLGGICYVNVQWTFLLHS